MNKISVLLLLMIVSTVCCYSQLIVDQEEAGSVENGKYTCYLFDWQIDIPSGFTITPQEQLEQLDDKGHAMLQENASDGENIIRQATHLIGFEKDRYNIFAATFESLAGTKKLSLEEHKQLVIKLLEETYAGSGLKFDIAKHDLMLGKHDFYKLLVHIYHPKTNQLILTQEFYTAYIKNHLFTATINYRDEHLGNVLTTNFMNSFQFSSSNDSEQFLIEEEILSEMEDIRSDETPFEITVKLKSDIEAPTNSEMMDLTLDFDVLKVDPNFYAEKTISVAMNATRKELIAQKFKSGGTYTFKVIKQVELMEEEPDSRNMVVGFTGAYERVLE